MRSIVALSIVALALPVAAIAQNGTFAPELRMLGANGELVTGQPYNVVEKMTTTETLADGTTIVHQTEEQKWRDAEGRFRKQTAQVLPSGEVVFHHAEIFDPVSHTLTMLELDKKTAVVMHLPERQGAHEVRTGGSAEPVARPGVQVKVEDLPPKTIAGVYGVGKKTTRIRPVGTVGNDRELVSTSERYDSPDLKILLYSSMDDPREKMVREVTSLTRQDPDATMFQAPQDFTVKDAPAMRHRSEQ